MKFMVKYKSESGVTMVLTYLGFAMDGFVEPKLCTSKEADMVREAIDTILIFEAGFTREDISRLCFYQEAVV